MNSTEQNKELDRWIAKVLRASPNNLKATYRAELEDHYWSAFEAGHRQGMTSETAHRHAMDRLGTLAEIKSAYTDSYHHYWKQAFWSIIMPAGFYVLMTSVAQHPGNLNLFRDWPVYRTFNFFFPLVLLIPLSYSLYSLWTLLRLRLQAESLVVPLIVTLSGLLFAIGIPWWLQYLPGISEEVSALTCQFGLVLSAIGMIGLCARLTSLKRALYGTRIMLQSAFVFGAAGLFCAAFLTVRLPGMFYCIAFSFAVLDYFFLCLALGDLFLSASISKTKGQMPNRLIQ